MRSSLICVAALLVAAVLAVAAGCNASTPTPARPRAGGAAGGLSVVAAENFWGSIAAQLAGSRARVQSVIVNPATDPHAYEPSAGDARALARADVVVLNGIGYDNWASRLLAASPSSGRAVLDVGKLLATGPSANPHQWYSPASVERVASQLGADYARLDPADAGYFSQRLHAFLGAGLARYEKLRAQIRKRFAGVAVGFSESIFEPLGDDLHLKLLTRGFARAITEGTDVSAADKEAVDALVQQRRIRVWVFNRQNVTPDVERVNQLVRERGIPLVPVTETLEPVSDTFQQWQVAQLEALLAALQRAGR